MHCINFKNGLNLARNPCRGEIFSSASYNLKGGMVYFRALDSRVKNAMTCFRYLAPPKNRDCEDCFCPASSL